MIVDLSTLNAVQRQNFLQHAVAPRPICFASTVDRDGHVNLSPFSFFNLFSTTPPIVIFSPSRRVRDNTTKHTLSNVLEVPEVVINVVDDEMVQQVSLSSCDYPKETNEFIKAGFTETPATLIRPPMVKESKISMECKVLEIKSLGNEGGSGNLVICEVLRMHINDAVLDKDGMIDQTKMHQVARLGGDWYSKTDGNSLFKVAKPNVHLGIGIDALPVAIKNSRYLTGNHLGQLANVEELPSVDPTYHDDKLKNIFQYYAVSPEEMEKELHLYAKELLEQDKVKEAWQVLLTASS